MKFNLKYGLWSFFGICAGVVVAFVGMLSAGGGHGSFLMLSFGLMLLLTSSLQNQLRQF